MSLSFATRRRIVRAFWRWHRWDGALKWLFEDLLRFTPRRHGFWWVIATFNFTSCHVCYGWRMWGFGCLTGVILAAVVSRFV